jgi:hypothetical protein
VSGERLSTVCHGFLSILPWYMTVTGKAASTPLTANSFMSASGVPLSTVDVVYCNFARLIQRYVRNFVRVDTPAALQYVYLLSLNADAPGTTGEEQVQACWDMIQAVILETRSYNLVLNEKAADGQSIVSDICCQQRYWLKLNSVHFAITSAQRAHARRQACQGSKPRRVRPRSDRSPGSFRTSGLAAE